MRGYYQHDENDCGLACIFTVCKMAGIPVNETELRKNTFLGQDGLSLYGMTKIMEKVGFSADAVSGTINELMEEYKNIKFPIIVLINENHMGHYVVMYGLKKKKIQLWDPNIGDRQMTMDEFGRLWSGYAICINEMVAKEKCIYPYRSACVREFFKDSKLMALLITFSVILLAVSMGTSYIYKEVIDRINTTMEFNLDDIVIFGIFGIAYIAIYALNIGKEKLLAYERKAFGIRLQDHFIDSIINMPVLKLDDYSSGGILDRFYRLHSVVELLISYFVTIVLEVVSLIAGSIILIYINPIMYLMTFVIVIAYVSSYYISKKKLYALNKKIMDKQALFTTHMKELMDSVITLKSFNSMSYRDRIKNENANVKELDYQLDNVVLKMNGTMDLIESMMMLIILAYGLYKMSMYEMSLGTVLAFEGFVGFFLSPVKTILSILPSLPEIILTFRKMDDVLVFSKVDSLLPASSYRIGDRIEFRDVRIEYGYKTPVLENVSFSIQTAVTFLVGESGSGKTTLAKMLAGLLKCEKGEIYVDREINIENVDVSGQMIYMPQEAEILTGTILENILLWDKELDNEKLQMVLSGTGLSKIIEKRAKGLNEYISENGDNLSGGEKQRIAIARALMSEAKIIVFDESTCHLDRKSESDVIEFIRNYISDKMCIFITHNLDLISEDDYVLYIDSKRNVVCQFHKQLFDTNTEYKRLIKRGH